MPTESPIPNLDQTIDEVAPNPPPEANDDRFTVTMDLLQPEAELEARAIVRGRLELAGYRDFFGSDLDRSLSQLPPDVLGDEQQADSIILSGLLHNPAWGQAAAQTLFPEPKRVHMINSNTVLFEGGYEGAFGLIKYGFCKDAECERDRFVVAKVLKRPATDERYAAEAARLRKETELLATLGGKVTPRLVGQGTTEGEWAGHLYYLMDYQPGHSFEALRRAALPQGIHPRLLRRLGRNSALALHHLHQQGVYHRDVKPANLYLTDDGIVILLDLGIAADAETRKHSSAASRLTLDGQGMGSAPYMPPEQQRDARHATDRSDVYSLGITLYQLATGNLPFTSDKFNEVLRQHREDTPDFAPLRAIDPNLADLVERMMAKEPMNRPAMLEAAQRLCKNDAEFQRISEVDDPKKATVFAPQHVDVERVTDPSHLPFGSRFAPDIMHAEFSRLLTECGGGDPVQTIQRGSATRLRNILALAAVPTLVVIAGVTYLVWPKGKPEGDRVVDTRPQQPPTKAELPPPAAPDIIHKTPSMQLTLDGQQKPKSIRLFPDDPDGLELSYDKGLHAYSGKEWVRSLYYLDEAALCKLMKLKSPEGLPKSMNPATMGPMPLYVLPAKVNGKLQVFIYLQSTGVLLSKNGNEIFIPAKVPQDVRMNFGRNGQRKGLMNMETMYRDSADIQEFCINAPQSSHLTSTEYGKDFVAPPPNPMGETAIDFIKKQVDTWVNKGMEGHAAKKVEEKK